MELLTLSSVFWLAAVPVFRLLYRRSHRSAAIGGLVILLLQGALIWAGIHGHSDHVPEEKMTARPAEIPAASYVGSQTCQACHPGEHYTWDASYHSSMTQIVSPETVRGDFDGQLLESFGWTYRPIEKDGKYFVRMTDPNWADMAGPAPEIDREVQLITGSHHMQIYWLAGSSERVLEQMPFVYLLDERRWIPRNSAFLKPLDAPMTEVGRWNRTCLNCHATGVRPNLVNKFEANTEVSNFGIACEACHGPCEEHVAAYQSPLQRYPARLEDDLDDNLDDATDAETAEGVVNPSKLDPHRSAEVCGQCHAILDYEKYDSQQWARTGFSYRPGDPLHQHLPVIQPDADEIASSLKSMDDNLPFQFWSDGFVRVSGREYNGLINTPCFTHEDASSTMTCLSCHVMHRSDDDPRPLEEWADDQLHPGMRGNEACTQCHSEFENEEALVQHTHHSADSSGSSCYNCHMSYTTYGLLKAIRSHTVESPSVAVTLKTGRPNACNQCHLDKTLKWTADHLKERYDIDSPELPEDESRLAASLIWLYKGDAAQRALMAWSLGWGPAMEASQPDWMPAHLAELLQDPYDAVRFIALRSLRRHAGFEEFAFDHLSRPGIRKKTSEQVIERWQATYDTPESSPEPHLLIDKQGHLDQEKIEALLMERDLTLIRLLE